MMKRNEVCLVSTWSERFEVRGQLALLHVSDTIHVVEYKDVERSIAVDVDLVKLRNKDATVRFTFPRGSRDELVFKIEDMAEFSVLSRAKEDCQSVCDLKLRLNSMLRDSYYSGVYSNLDPDAKLILCEEVERMKKDNPGIFFSSLLNSKEMRDDSAMLGQKEGRAGAISVPLIEVCCIFCGLTRNADKDMEFMVHPNVPKNSQGRFLFMCSVCLENWKEFRETAEHEGQLILPGEVNEEVCAICSDTPGTLILCGQCARSYCDGCLERVISESELLEIKTQDSDWMCMCCTSGFCQNPPLGRSAWKMVVPCQGKRGLTYGNLVPYTQHGNTLVSMSSELHNSAEASKIRNAVANGAPIDSVVAQLAQGQATKNKRGIGYSLDEDLNELSDRSNSPRPTNRKIVKQSGRGSGGGSVIGGGGGTSSGSPVGRYRRNSSYSIEEVDSVAAFQSQNKLASSSNNRGQRMQKRYQEKDRAPGQPVLDEKYYFGQYVGYYSLLCEEVSQWKLLVSSKKHAGGGKKKQPVEDIPTDDVCFLCKDGGDLIECDWRCPTAKNGERCLKVYHEYCLDYTVADDDWNCPRHYCDMCGGKALKYICKYCPISLCANCPESFVSQYGSARYCLVEDPLTGPWCHSPTASGMQTIVCQTCTEMLESIERIGSSSSAVISSAGMKGNAPIELVRSELSVQRKFPGVYAGSKKGEISSIYLKDVPATSSDEQTIASETFVFTKDARKSSCGPARKSLAQSSAASASSSNGVKPKALVKSKTLVKPAPSTASLKALTQLAAYNAKRNYKGTKGRKGNYAIMTATSSDHIVHHTEEAPTTEVSCVSKGELINSAEPMESTKPLQSAEFVESSEPAERVEPVVIVEYENSLVPDATIREVGVPDALMSVLTKERLTTLNCEKMSAPSGIGKKRSNVRSLAATNSSPAASPRSSASVSGAMQRGTKGARRTFGTVPPAGGVLNISAASNKGDSMLDLQSAVAIDGSRCDSSLELPKKRAASSIASSHISAQLKGENASRFNASSSAYQKEVKEDAKKTTSTSNGQATANSNSSKNPPVSSRARPAGGADEETSDEEVIHVVKRQTRSSEPEQLSARTGKKVN